MGKTGGDGSMCYTLREIPGPSSSSSHAPLSPTTSTPSIRRNSPSPSLVSSNSTVHASTCWWSTSNSHRLLNSPSIRPISSSLAIKAKTRAAKGLSPLATSKRRKAMVHCSCNVPTRRDSSAGKGRNHWHAQSHPLFTVATALLFLPSVLALVSDDGIPGSLHFAPASQRIRTDYKTHISSAGVAAKAHKATTITTTTTAAAAAAFANSVQRAQTADELGVPECRANSDCVFKGVCVKDRQLRGRCLCSSSCPLNVPVQCNEANEYSCGTMGSAYTAKYALRKPLCYHKRCICPPRFDPSLIQPPMPGFTSMLPMKCDRRDLRAMIVASPSAESYRGTTATIFCCVNVDPRDFIPPNFVYFVQNSTRKLETSHTPYENFSPDIDTLFTVPTCWSYQIVNVQLSDSGTYTCLVQPLEASMSTLNVTLEFSVKMEPSESDTAEEARPSQSDELGVKMNSSEKEEENTKDRGRRNAGSRIGRLALNFEPPTPRMIQNVSILANSTWALLDWNNGGGGGGADAEDHPSSLNSPNSNEGESPDPPLKINLELYRRSDRKTKVWHREGITAPPVRIEHLASATPYTLFITVIDGESEPFRLTEQFQTLDALPDPPLLEDIRLVNSAGGEINGAGGGGVGLVTLGGIAGAGQMCEIEWRPPRHPRGHITRYYVRIVGRMRYVPAPSGRLTSEQMAPDFPAGVGNCANYRGGGAGMAGAHHEEGGELVAEGSNMSGMDGGSENFEGVDEEGVNGDEEGNGNGKWINPSLFQSFFACKYGPLRPNRNYTATVWAENKAGRSRPITYPAQCVTDFAQPNRIVSPETVPRSNISSGFGLRFNEEPVETNGPIECYYLAVLPLPANVSLAELGPPEQIVMDTFDKAIQNNLAPAATTNNRYFAYIAESYMRYPEYSVVGDGRTSGGVEPCNVLYLTRFKPIDPALSPLLKYTGFLIARVDRDRSLQWSNGRALLTPPRVVADRPPVFSSPSHLSGNNNGQSPRLGRVDMVERLRLRRSSPSSNTNSEQGGQWVKTRRQLANVDPAYGFSGYFKPVVLSARSGNGAGSVISTLLGGHSAAVEIALIALFAMLFVALSLSAGMCFFKARKRQHRQRQQHQHVVMTQSTSSASTSSAQGANRLCPRMPRRLFHTSGGIPSSPSLHSRRKWLFWLLPWKKHHDLLHPAGSSRTHGYAGAPPPIRAEELANEYAIRHRDSDYLFTQEFEQLPRGKNLDHTISERKENQRKNRYNDIKACDATRVRLKVPSPLGGGGGAGGARGKWSGGPPPSDYINANFVKGYKSRKVFIATQGPLDCTVADFWRMVWEQHCQLIIMVANLRERGREQCVKYWPDEDEKPLKFGELRVQAVESTFYADYAIREFELSNAIEHHDDEDELSRALGMDHERNGLPNGPTGLSRSVSARENRLLGTSRVDSPPLLPNAMSSSVQSRHSLMAMTERDRPDSTAPFSAAHAAKHRSTPTASGGHGEAHSPVGGTNNNYKGSNHIRSGSGEAANDTTTVEYANLEKVVIRPGSRGSRRLGFEEENDGERDRRRVLQYHFTAWHDYKAPECCIALLRLMSKLRRLDAYNNAPAVVHCSAGVGRTGTLIAIDYVMDQCREEGWADVFGCVAEMRQQRNLMVQSVEQYVFIYKALAENQLFGDTDLSVLEYRSHYARLRLTYQPPARERHHSLSSTSAKSANAVNIDAASEKSGSASSLGKLKARLAKGGGGALRNGPTVGLSGGQQQQTAIPLIQQNGGAGVGGIAAKPTLLEREFNNLSVLLERARPSDIAHRAEYAPKNRFVDAVPYNHNRVVLAPMVGQDNTYINASLVRGHFYPYILAQDPMDAGTVFDFWRMIHDHNCYSVVQLCPDVDEFPEGRRSATKIRVEEGRYWPAAAHGADRRITLGGQQSADSRELTVTLISEEKVGSGIFTQRRLFYKFKGDRGQAPNGREVLQYVFRKWRIGSPTPQSAHALLELIGRVLERQSSWPDAGPIILHCPDGSAEAGLFCCVSLLLERLKSEHMIDVFRTVRALQLQRPLLFTKIEQYAFCYDCVTEYLNSSRSSS